ncbi:hypothetical protein JCM17960_17570 [Magnetospira thiophila]
MKILTACLYGTAAGLLLVGQALAGDNPWRSPGWQVPQPEPQYQQDQSTTIVEPPHMDTLPQAPLMQQQGVLPQSQNYAYPPRNMEYPPDDLDAQLEDKNNRRFGPGTYGPQDVPSYPAPPGGPRSSSNGYVYEVPSRPYTENPTVYDFYGPHEFSPYGGGGSMGGWPLSGGSGIPWPGYSTW